MTRHLIARLSEPFYSASGTCESKPARSSASSSNSIWYKRICWIELAAERHLIKLLQDGFVETFADAVRLWMPRLGLGVLDVVQGQVELIVMGFRLAAILRTAVGQHADDTHVVFGNPFPEVRALRGLCHLN